MDRTLSEGRDLDALFELMMGTRLREEAGPTTSHQSDPASSSASSFSSGARRWSQFDASFSSDRHYNRTYYEHKQRSGDDGNSDDEEEKKDGTLVSTVDWDGEYSTRHRVAL